MAGVHQMTGAEEAKKARTEIIDDKEYESKSGEVERVEIECADGGYVVTCYRKPPKSSGKDEPVAPYELPHKKVVATKQGLKDLIEETL